MPGGEASSDSPGAVPAVPGRRQDSSSHAAGQAGAATAASAKGVAFGFVGPFVSLCLPIGACDTSGKTVLLPYLRLRLLFRQFQAGAIAAQLILSYWSKK
jgi:hypothetical protein